MPRPAAPALPLTAKHRQEWHQFKKVRSTPQSVLLRLQIVLGAADGVANKVLARRLSTTLPTVLRGRSRDQAEGLAGIVEDRPRSGRPQKISPEQESAIGEATHWSVRSMAKLQGVSPATVQRVWKKHHPQLHRRSGGAAELT